VLKTREFIRAAEASVKDYDQSLIVASNRVAAGTALRTERLDLEVRLAQAREDLVRARNAHTLSERALRAILGLAEGEFTVADAVPAVAAPTGDDFSRRPELAAVREQERAAEAQVRQVQAGQRPRLNAFGSVDYDYGSRMGGDGNSFTAGVIAQWDLWDGQLTRGRVREARANLEAAREEERKLLLGIGLEVEQARLALNEAAERLAVTEAAVAQAQESVELTRARFGQGLLLASQLIDAETALIGARVRRAEAEADRRIAIAALRKALGWPQLTAIP
jgi:outer membrane protein TolC